MKKWTLRRSGGKNGASVSQVKEDKSDERRGVGTERDSGMKTLEGGEDVKAVALTGELSRREEQGILSR